MPHPLLSALQAPSLNEMEAALRAGENIAVTGLAEGQAAFVASKLASCGLKVLLVTANDLRAASAAADAGTLLSSGVASLPGGELDLVRGASSQESAWRRVEALSQLAQGQIRLLTVSMDALMQRKEARLREDRARLEAISPRRVLERGYALVTAGDRVVIRAAEAPAHMPLHFADGQVPVEKIIAEE